MCQGFSDFSNFVDHFVLTKLATSGIRVKPSMPVDLLVMSGPVLLLKITVIKH